MAMSVGPAESDAPMSDINTTPLVDVMLVLLIIFLITVPVVIQTVPVTLPKVAYEPTTSKPENVVLSIRGKNGQCEVYWGQTRIQPQELIDRSVAKLKLEIDKQGGPTAPGLELPEVHIRADVNTPWRCVGGAMTNVARAGFARVAFISQPDPGEYHAAVE
ncbi:biopolymer transport protein ExbD [Sphingomonas vulcanisoli]|uniref:Biopolymer transport protein ExbD n=1 Tax=Sphingomonas vulcanisoli TaxID=1658060 RepID=A0ABX0TTP1_9SPHN|nr:biopolymer transporter ExbD [Sphingomonas vulcanisoli]NIJ08099.1 biopolymer transport protein ExbD [Sphingomonas vulcanisoli]